MKALKYVPILVLAASCVAGPSPLPSEPPSPSPALPATERIAWWEQQLEGAPSIFERAAARLELGLVWLEQGNPTKARIYLRKALYEFPDSPKRARTRLAIGESYVMEEDATNADTELREAIADLPPGPHLDRAYLLLALSLEARGLDEEAAAFRDRIHPRSRSSLQPLEANLAFKDKAPEPTPVVRDPEPAPVLRPPMAIIPRKTWKPQPIRGNYDRMGEIKRITMHHSADFFYRTDPLSTQAEIRRIQRAHQKGNGWADIGYHFLVDRAGRVWEGRPITMQGSHAGKSQSNGVPNRNNLGICVLGNYNNQTITSYQEDTLRKLLDFFMARYSVPPKKVFTHQEIKKVYGRPATECPGTHLQSLISQLRRNFGIQYRRVGAMESGLTR